MSLPVDRRRKNRNWLVTDEQGTPYDDMRDAVSVALLMDIRDELQKLNALFGCVNFTTLPATLRGLRRDFAAERKARQS